MFIKQILFIMLYTLMELMQIKETLEGIPLFKFRGLQESIGRHHGMKHKNQGVKGCIQHKTTKPQPQTQHLRQLQEDQKDHNDNHQAPSRTNSTKRHRGGRAWAVNVIVTKCPTFAGCYWRGPAHTHIHTHTQQPPCRCYPDWLAPTRILAVEHTCTLPVHSPVCAEQNILAR